MKKLIFPVACMILVLVQSTVVTAQKKPVKKTVPPAITIKPVTTNVATNPAIANTAGMNTLSYTIEEQNGGKRDMLITSSPKAVNEQSSYFNTARVDQAHKDADGNKQPILKLDINNDKNQNLSAAMIIPVVNDTGTVLATYQSDYDNIIGWNIHFDGYRLGPQNITITITKWAAVGDFMEGMFTGSASLVKENMIYDSDNPAPTVNIKNGKFRIKRVKDQTSYGGE